MMDWRGERWRFETPLKPEVCAERLRPVVDGYFKLFGDNSLIGHVSPQGARLKKRIGYRNDFQSQLTARFRQDGAKTIVEGRTGMNDFTLAFLAFWFVVVTPFSLWIAVSGSRGPDAYGEKSLLELLPIVTIAFAVAVVAFGRWLARNEAAFLKAALRSRLDVPGA